MREAVTRMLIRLLESRSAILHALIELISLDEVVTPNYWKKTPGGVLWSPSVAVQERWARRSEDLAILLSEPELKVLLPQTTRSTRRTP